MTEIDMTEAYALANPGDSKLAKAVEALERIVAACPVTADARSLPSQMAMIAGFALAEIAPGVRPTPNFASGVSMAAGDTDVASVRAGEALVDRAARAIFKNLYGWESWEDFDERREARGGLHPHQDTAFELARVAIAASRVPELTEALNAARELVAKLDECEPHAAGAFQMAAIHGAEYRGPEYGTALEGLRAALALIGEGK